MYKGFYSFDALTIIDEKFRENLQYNKIYGHYNMKN